MARAFPVDGQKVTRLCARWPHRPDSRRSGGNGSSMPLGRSSITGRPRPLPAVWSDLDVFGCDPDRPDARFDAMGLVLLLERCEIVGIDEGGADLIASPEARLRYRRRPLPRSYGLALATRTSPVLTREERSDGKHGRKR